MTNTAGLFAIALVALASTPPGPGRPARLGLPIRYSGEEGIVEVPLETGQLGYAPTPSRSIIAEPLEPVGGDDVPDGEVIPAPARRPRPLNTEEKAVKGECFDLRVFGELTEEKRKLWLLSTLSEKVVDARRRGLSAAGEEKLVLAGMGDIKRFFVRVEEHRVAFEAIRRDYIAGKQFLRGPDIDSLSVEFQRGPFGEGSLFAKTLRKIEQDRAEARGR